MTWINTIDYDKAKGKLLRFYDRIKGPGGHIDNILFAHSLRPHTLEGHMALYKSVLHHAGNAVPKWFLEALGIYTSMLNHCDYCVEHHYAGMSRLLDDEDRAIEIRAALENKTPTQALDEKHVVVFEYAKKLTEKPAEVREEDIEKLRLVGWDDGEILEINQVVAYFNYANRTVLGLGISLENEKLGMSPNDSDDPENWQHT